MLSTTALLVIDMQKGSFTPATPRYDTPGVVARINQLASACRNGGATVVYVQHDGTGSGEFEKGTADWENLDELEVLSSDIRIDKYANDVFYRSALQSQLQSRGITHLLITGCATDFCVEATIQSALTHDYHITVVADGHTTGERPQLTAKQVIDHYNWVWQNMIPTRGSLTVKPTKEILGKHTG